MTMRSSLASRPWRRLAGCAASLALGSAAAQTPSEPAPTPSLAFDLSPVSVRAAPSGPLSSRAVLTSVDTLGGEAIQDAATQANYELLARLPGVQLTVFGQGTTSGKPSFRGFNGEGEVNAVKLLIDGVPSNSHDGNMPYLDLLASLGLASITTVRGTNDARYGLHNVAGHIDLATRQGGNATDLRVGAGPWGQADAQLAVDRERDGVAQNLAIGLRHVDGWRDHAAADRASLAWQGSLVPDGRDLKLGLALRAHHAEAQEPGYLTQAGVDDDPRQSPPWVASDGGRRNVGQAVLSAEGGLTGAWSWRTLAYLNRYVDERWVTFSEAVPQQERVTDETHRGLRALFAWRSGAIGGVGVALEGGVDTERQHNQSRRWLTDDRVRTQATRDQHWSFDTVGAFVQAVLQPAPDWKLVPGYRIDRLSGRFHDDLAGVDYRMNDYGTIGQPKLSLVWSPTDQLSAYANWGRTFQVGIGRASYRAGSDGDGAKASINDGSELGLKFQSDRLTGRLAAWQQTATNEFSRLLNDPSGDSVNIGATRRRGVDLQLRVQASATLAAYATLGLQKAVIRTPRPGEDTRGKEIDHVPQRLYNAGVDWQALPALALGAWLQGQSDYWLERSNSATGKYGAYTTLNLSARYALSPTLQLEAQLLNAADARREYVWWDGTQTLHAPGDPRALNVALRASF